jgi:hypothetical protein
VLDLCGAGGRVRTDPLLAHAARSAYGSFLARSARTGSNSGTRASGRFDPFTRCRGNGRFFARSSRSRTVVGRTCRTI